MPQNQRNDGNGLGNGGFESPPEEDAGGAQDTASYEDAGVWETPSESAAEGAAEVEQSSEGMAVVSAEAMEVKQAIEEVLAANVAAGGGTQTIESLQGVGNIQGVAFGTGDDLAGSSVGEPGMTGVTVYVAEPTSVDEIRAVLVESMGVQAASLDTVGVNIEQVGIIEPQSHRFRIRRAPGGVSVGHFKVTAGTIGCLAVGRTPPRSNRLMILSNNHVIANSNNAVGGQCICQPGTYDGGKCPQDQIAVLERFVTINFGGGTNYVDCATGWAWPDRVRRDLIYLSGGVQKFFRIGNVPVAPALGMLVGKTGRTTQLTQGRITGIGATIQVNYGGGRVALFRDQFAVKSTGSGTFSAGGDSGSSIWTWNAQRSPVGLLFAGGGGVTFANRMTRVVTALDINLYT